MKNKIVDLQDLIKLIRNKELSEKYVRYISGLNSDHKYRHSEIEDISKLLININLSRTGTNGFIYDYSIPQLNKEFDLLKITKKKCINIELKSQEIPIERIEKQLIQNRHYLDILKKDKNYLYTYVANVNKLYFLVNDKITQVDFRQLNKILLDDEIVSIDLDEIFSTKNVLISPLNDTKRFLNHDYLLTENQHNIKNKVISLVKNKEDNDSLFIQLNGGAGTGKTLLLYDMAKSLGDNFKVQIVHCGMLCEGHLNLVDQLTNVNICPIKDFFCDINEYDIYFVDEAQRCRTSDVRGLIDYIKRTNKTCIFSNDAKQQLSHSEEMGQTLDNIDDCCLDHKFYLKNKIRTNKEMALFITCLFDLSKYRKDEYRYKYPFNNVHIIYEPYNKDAVTIASMLEEIEGYKYISYTPSYYDSSLDYQQSNNNTHRVIGQEFEKVCMIIDNNFYYDGEILKAYRHPNPDYIFTKLLYEGLTRVRNELTLIITNESILEKVLEMFN